MTFPPSARPCCDKRGNVTWKAPVYSQQRKSGCKGQGAAVGSRGCAGPPTCHSTRAESPGELPGLGTVASSLQQLWHGGERKVQLEHTDLGILPLFCLVFLLCSFLALFILKDRGCPCPLPLVGSLPWWPDCPVPVTSSGSSWPLLRFSALMMEKNSSLAFSNTSWGSSCSSGRARARSCSRTSRSRCLSCRTFSRLASRSNIWGRCGAEGRGGHRGPCAVSGDTAGLWAECGARVGPGTYCGGQGLLVLPHGAEPWGDLQQGDNAQPGAAAEDAPVVLRAQAEQGIVGHLGTGHRWVVTLGPGVM